MARSFSLPKFDVKGVVGKPLGVVKKVVRRVIGIFLKIFSVGKLGDSYLRDNGSRKYTSSGGNYSSGSSTRKITGKTPSKKPSPARKGKKSLSGLGEDLLKTLR